MYSQNFPMNITQLDPGDSIIITYHTTVDPDLPEEIEAVSCQIRVDVNGNMILSDDPRTPDPNDPTVTTVSHVVIPTLSEWGLIILLLLMMDISLVTLVKRKTHGHFLKEK